jgi:ADP-ribose pyrophosphatase YjhB (NUDIX family)
MINDGQLLMIRRTDQGQWAIPGGAQGVGETPPA